MAEIKILNPERETSSPGNADYFTGMVEVRLLVQGQTPSNLASALVTFQPTARTAWHTHPKGQLLVVTEGNGLVQEWGKPVQAIAKGNVIWFPPGVKHWHGATPQTSLTHVAIQEALDGKVVEWLEKVTDAEYLQRG